MQLQIIQTKIYEVRKQRVILDFDIAQLFGVETRVLNQAVKRNMERFPEKFMFQLTKEEWQVLISQFVISKKERRGGTQKMPFAFTEHGVTMLASVLRSRRAVKMNIAIVEAFIALKDFALNYKELSGKLKYLEKKYNKQFKNIYEALKYLLNKDILQIDQSERKRIGYKQ